MANYEVLDQIFEDTGEAKLAASWTPNNGIRLGILNHYDETEACIPTAGEDGWAWCWSEFDLTKDQARTLGAALIRWANDQPPQAWVEAKKEIDEGWPDR